MIYVGPMGCRTGFYLLTRGLTPAQALALTVESDVYKRQLVPRSTPGFTPLPQIRYGTYSRVWSVVLV